MSFLKSEVKKTMSIKTVLFLIVLAGISSYIMQLIEPNVISVYYKDCFGQFSLLYLITIFAYAVSYDFEQGTFKQVYTGRFSAKKVIVLKLLALLLIAIFFAVLVFVIPILIEFTMYSVVNYSLVEFTNLVLAYVVSSFAMGSFAMFLGYVFKRLDLTLLLTFILHFVPLPQLLLTVMANVHGGTKQILSFLYFPMVSLAFKNRVIMSSQAVILCLSGLVFLILSMLYISIKDIYKS